MSFIIQERNKRSETCILLSKKKVLMEVYKCTFAYRIEQPSWSKPLARNEAVCEVFFKIVKRNNGGAFKHYILKG